MKKILLILLNILFAHIYSQQFEVYNIITKDNDTLIVEVFKIKSDRIIYFDEFGQKNPIFKSEILSIYNNKDGTNIEYNESMDAGVYLSRSSRRFFTSLIITGVGTVISINQNNSDIAYICGGLGLLTYCAAWVDISKAGKELQKEMKQK